MGQPYQANLDNSVFKRCREQTLGSETSQYQEENKPIGIPLVAASETGEAQTQPQYRRTTKVVNRYWGMGVIRLQDSVIPSRVTNCLTSGIIWEDELQRVTVPYTKVKQLYGCSS
jgi:hypothetical protein